MEIDGQGRLICVNPATGAEIARVPCSTTAGVRDAVGRARAAQPAWAATPLAKRVGLLKRATAALAARREELVATMVAEMGKVRQEAEEEVDGAIDKDEYLDLISGANEPQRTEKTEKRPTFPDGRVERKKAHGQGHRGTRG